jgi:hypothetical protein
MMTSTLLYKDHAIIAAGKPDEKTRKYKTVVHISWHGIHGRRECHPFALPERRDTLDAASALALKAAKTWVDRHLIDGSASASTA